MALNEKKLITALTGVLVVLAIVVLLVLSSRYRENRKEDSSLSGLIPAAEEGGDDYTSLTYFNGSTTLAFHRDESGKWIWSHDETFPLDESHVVSVVNALLTLSPPQTLSTVESLEDCGLTQPSATFSAKRGDGSSISLSFGNMDVLMLMSAVFPLSERTSTVIFPVSSKASALPYPVIDFIIC